MEEEEQRGVRPINRPGHIGARTRRLKKLIGKKEWYKNKKNNKKREAGDNEKGHRKRVEQVEEVKSRQIEAVMFVPFTKNSDLQRRLQQIDDTYISAGREQRIKFVERSGSGTLEESEGERRDEEMG